MIGGGDVGWSGEQREKKTRSAGEYVCDNAECALHKIRTLIELGTAAAKYSLFLN